MPFRECSKGMRQRIALAQALVNDPELLILDEPTSGLDPAGRHQMTRIILELKRRGKTILLCSHFLAEVEEVCDRVGILYMGRLVAEGSLAELTGEPTEIVIATSDLAPAQTQQIADHPSVVSLEGGVLRMARADEDQLWAVLQLVHQAGGKIVEVTRPRPGLQDVFVRAIGEERK